MRGADSRENLLALRRIVNRLKGRGGDRQTGSRPDEPGRDSAQLSEIILLHALERLRRQDVVRQALDVRLSLENPDASDLFFLMNSIWNRVACLVPSLGQESFPPARRSNRLVEIWTMLNQSQDIFDRFDERSSGYIYQLFSERDRKEAQSSAQTGDKRTSTRQLTAFTQLYTPDWVVDFLLANTLYALWRPVSSADESTVFNSETDGNDGGGSGITGGAAAWSAVGSGNAPDNTVNDLTSRGSAFSSQDSWRAYEGLCVNRHPKISARAATLIDPACGSGHFLLRALDLFMHLYHKEGASKEEALLLSTSHNLTGFDIDRTGLWICALGIWMKSLNRGPLPHPLRLFAPEPATERTYAADESAAELGSLLKEVDTSHPLAQRYDVVVTNPPYVGRRLIDRRLKAALRRHYPLSHHDISAAFLERGLALLKDGGRLGFITQSSIMYLKSYTELRREILSHNGLIHATECGAGVFPLQKGEKVDSVLLVIEAGKPAHARKHASYIDLTESADKPADLQHLASSIDQGTASPLIILRRQEELSELRHAMFNFKCPRFIRQIMSSSARLAELCQIRQGLATSDNARFLRLWWQVDPEEIGSRWVPYVKGAGGERWFSPVEHVVDWQDNGSRIKEAVAKSYPYLRGKTAWVVKNESFYFRPGITFSFVNTGVFAARLLESGCIFDVGGSSIFPADEDRLWLLAYLNSSLALTFAELLNPTINIQVGDLKDIPLVSFDSTTRTTLACLAQECIADKMSLVNLSGRHYSCSPPPEISRVLQGENPATVWSALSSGLSRTLSRLIDNEAKIDAIVLTSAAREFNLGDAAFAELETLCAERARRRKPSGCFPESEEHFATALLAMSSQLPLPAYLAAGCEPDGLQNLPDSAAAWITGTIGRRRHRTSWPLRLRC